MNSRPSQNRFQRVLLVSPPSSSYLGAARPPQNLGYLAESLLQNNIDYDILDMRLGYRIKDLLKKIKTYEPDLIGFSLVSLEYKKSYHLISATKHAFPHIKTIAGGPHLTVLQEHVLEECPDIDFGVVYEGEKTLSELCQNRLPVSEIKGLIRRIQGKIQYNGHRIFEKNLDDIPYPTYQKFELHKYIREMPFNSSRGCPFRCVFCPNKMITKKFRWRSPKHVVDEIEYWYKKGIRTFNYDDDNFSFFKDRIFAICDEIETREIRDAEFRCSNGLRADKIDKPLLARMKQVGFNYIAFGVDGGNDHMLRMNKKGETIDQIDSAIRTACELGFDVKIFCILAMPYETLPDIEDSFRMVQKYPVKRVILNNPIPYPGTELFETVKNNGWFIKQPEEYLNHVTENENVPVFVTPEISLKERKKILKRSRKIEKRVTRKAVRQMYKKYPLINSIMALLFATDFVENLFFNNMKFRRFIEKIRYRRMLKSRRIQDVDTEPIRLLE
ncbi:radical SAM protein [bacterium]|nr:radical SAM protein [bacterium]RQV97199.1 MAG: radical SAM protein [bacterium]